MQLDWEQTGQKGSERDGMRGRGGHGRQGNKLAPGLSEKASARRWGGSIAAAPHLGKAAEAREVPSAQSVLRNPVEGISLEGGRAARWRKQKIWGEEDARRI